MAGMMLWRIEKVPVCPERIHKLETNVEGMGQLAEPGLPGK